MIAAAGYHRLVRGDRDGLALDALAERAAAEAQTAPWIALARRGRAALARNP